MKAGRSIKKAITAASTNCLTFQLSPHRRPNHPQLITRPRIKNAMNHTKNIIGMAESHRTIGGM